LTEFEKSSGLVSCFWSFAGVPLGEPDELRFGGILMSAGTEYAVLTLEMEEAEE
jgi:hypothetical protein